MKFGRLFTIIVALTITTTVALGTTACAPAHVVLRSPGANASLQEREAAYRQLRAEALSMTHVTHYQNGRYAGESMVTNHLQLRGGMLVAHPEDLVPLVLPNSPTANFARDYLRNRHGARRSWGAASLLYVIGTAVMLTSLTADIDDEDAFFRRLAIGGGFSLAGCVAMIPAYVFGSRANSARHAAFVAYEHDLPEALGFCEDTNGELADCGASAVGIPGMR